MKITGGILAGGAGRRVGGRDKGWLRLAQQPLIWHVMRRLKPQVDELLISANRNLSAYRELPVAQVLTDDEQDHPGPMQGILRLLQAASHPLLIVPCDCPYLPLDLASRLWQGLGDADADIAVAHDGSYPQPLFALLKPDELTILQQAYESGLRSMKVYLTQRKTLAVDFSDQPQAFINLNTPEDFAALYDLDT
jgi:molybdenum cofactor guanylyltransferase